VRGQTTTTAGRAGPNQLPVATIGIILVNVAIALLIREDVQGALRNYGLIPSQLNAGRILTSSFLHEGLAHLVLNMLLLYVFGREVEKAIGWVEFIAFYAAACFVSTIVHVAVVFAALPPYYADRVVVGASGAVAGVMGLYAVRFHRRVVNFGGLVLPVLLLIMAWLLVNLGLGILVLYRDEVLGVSIKYVSYWSHLGGLAFGVGVALVFNMALTGEREYLALEARRLDAEGNLLESAQHYERLLRHDPLNADAYADLARVWAALEEAEQSLSMFKAAIELYVAQGKEEPALQTAESMRAYWPDTTFSEQIRYRYASSLEESGNTDSAIAELRKVADSSSDGSEAQMALLKLGHLQLTAAKDPIAARATLSELLTRFPNTEWRRFTELTLSRAAAD
jgi:membrane associated rhomboid family serine protease